MAELTPEDVDRVIAKGREMRRWQRKYDAKHDTPASKQNALETSKRLEREFDRLLDEVVPPPSQTPLFPAHDDPRPGAYSR